LGSAQNPSIGIVLCKSTKRDYRELVICVYNKPMGVATYKTTAEMPEELRRALPDIEEIEETAVKKRKRGIDHYEIL
jgi:hypothetical protein